MKRGLAYITALLVVTILLFYMIASWLSADNPAIVFFLAMLAADKILDKNTWLIDAFEDRFTVKSPE